MAKESLNPGDLCFWEALHPSKNMFLWKIPAEIKENWVNMAVYKELFNGAEQSCLVGAQREESASGAWETWNGFVSGCTRPQKMKPFSPPKEKTFHLGIYQTKQSVGAGFGLFWVFCFVCYFFTGTYLFQWVPNDCALPTPGSDGRNLKMPRTLTWTGVCKSCSPAFQQVC